MKILDWVNDRENMTWQAMMRFSMVVLSSLLFGMYCGQSVPPEIGELCRLFALSGMAFYFSLEMVADRRTHRRVLVAQYLAERKLTRQLHCEDKLVSSSKTLKATAPKTTNISEQSFGVEQSLGNVESAMDSTADLAVYLGRTSQPVLSA